MAATFHFSKETPPESLFTDIQTLNKFQDEQFHELVAILFAFLIEPSKSSRLLSQLDEFSEQNSLSSAALKNVFKSLLYIPNSALRRNVTPAQLKEDFVNLGLSDDRSSHIEEQWKSKLLSLSKSALSRPDGQPTCRHGVEIGVTAASSELNKVGNTFLQLKLVINNGNGTSNVYMELTLPQFYSFLHEMESQSQFRI
ncbi:hypothetical protein ScPMuIL_008553 [Solemya velum]